LFDAAEKCYYIAAQRMHMTGRIIVEDRAAYEAENDIKDYKRDWDRFELTEPIEIVVERYAADPIMFIKSTATSIEATGAALHKKEIARDDIDEMADYMHVEGDGINWTALLRQIEKADAGENVARVEPTELF
jgi:hypothetical protein